MRINLTIQIKYPRWWNKLFRCKHKVVSVEEDFDSRYGTHTLYLYCLKCGRQAMDIERNCKHELDCFGKCVYCKSRIEKHDCEHYWINEPDTDDWYCDLCGEWKYEEE